MVEARQMAVTIPDQTVDGVLQDGTRVVFRPIRPTDKPLLKRGMKLLSPESRYRRFFAPIDHLSPEQLRYFTEIDYDNHFAWVGVLAGSRPLLPVGVARYIRLDGDPEAAEAAVTVLDSYQRQGVGSALLRLLARSAIEHGIRRFVLVVMGDNEAMMTLLLERGAVVDRWEDGVAHVHVQLPRSIDEVDASPLPPILRAAAEGKLSGTSGPRGVGTWFREQ